MFGKLYQEFPRIAPLAETFGFTYEDIAELVSKAHSKLKDLHIYENREMVEVYLRALIYRLDKKRDEFMKYISELNFNFNDYNINQYKAMVGVTQVPVLWALQSR